MHMIPTVEHIARLASKVARLVKDFKSLEKENDKLKQELQQKSAEGDLLLDRCRVMEQQLNLLLATSGQSSIVSRRDLEKQLNHYIKEIDRCISLLGE